MPSPFEIPPGFALQLLPKPTWKALPLRNDANFADSLLDKLLVWEPPRRGFVYVLSADIGGGVGQDYSVIDVTRVGTLTEPDEQVAQFVSNTIDPTDFAHPIDVIGRFYADEEGEEAMAAIECNIGPGIATQAELQRHLGYSNFFIWQYYDKTDVSRSFSRSIGWFTTPKTRPLIISRYIKAVNTLDPVTLKPDYLINSPFTIEELQDFQTAGQIWEAEAASGATDDCIMTGAIAVWVAQTLHFEDREPLADQRRRQSEEAARKAEGAALHGNVKPDFQNTDTTYDEMMDREEFYQEREGNQYE